MFVFARNIVLFGVKKSFCCRELACVRDGCGRRHCSVELCSARAVELRVPSDFLSSLLMLCYGVLQLRIVNRIAVAA